MRKLLNEELNRISIEKFREVKKLPLVVVLDNVRSMHNIGSVFRSSDAFRVECIHLCGITATPPHKDIYKTALGATDSVLWKYHKETVLALEMLKKEGYKLIGIEQTEESISLQSYETKPGEKYAIVFGHEVRGVGQDAINMCDSCIEIPQFGTKHSLNISVCAGVVIWEFFRKLSDFSA